jgi:hypothetical protein
MHGIVDVNGDIFELSTNVNLRGHSYKLIKPVANVNSRSHSFACRMIDCWNSLPQAAVDSASASVFRTKLNTIDFTKFLHVTD